MVGGECIDDTPVHKALRETLANCLINADYHGLRDVVIRKEILNATQPEQWYKAAKFEAIAGVKESRIKVLLKDMTEQGLIESTGSTKGKMYRKAKH